MLILADKINGGQHHPRHHNKRVILVSVLTLVLLLSRFKVGILDNARIEDVVAAPGSG